MLNKTKISLYGLATISKQKQKRSSALGQGTKSDAVPKRNVLTSFLYAYMLVININIFQGPKNPNSRDPVKAWLRTEAIKSIKSQCINIAYILHITIKRVFRYFDRCAPLRSSCVFVHYDVHPKYPYNKNGKPFLKVIQLNSLLKAEIWSRNLFEKYNLIAFSWTVNILR